MKNIENIQKVLNIIEKNPSSWNQSRWHCGTSHCFAGWAQIVARKPICDHPLIVIRDARLFFGFTQKEADYYFAGGRTFKELQNAVNPWYDEHGFDINGYNDQGFNKQGYDRKGYNAEGYNAEGYNAEGYDRNGYNLDGFNESGYDKNGFDKEGYDIYNLDINNNLKP